MGTLRLSARWMVLAGFGLGFLLSGFAFLGQEGRSAGAQPIAFNHAVHVANGLACLDCHTGVETEARATIPALEACMNCHATALGKSAEEQKVRAFAAAGREPAWHPVSRVPAHVYFSHRRHVSIAKVSCATCHGPMEQLTAPPVNPFREFTMNLCVDCHQRNGGGVECNDCHR
ncbi:MAG: cytochrome c3 family protein [Acidobacteria bacterium]|nr:cytochrome c3 family protein [Acidobacteriota bacterium]